MIITNEELEKQIVHQIQDVLVQNELRIDQGIFVCLVMVANLIYRSPVSVEEKKTFAKDTAEDFLRICNGIFGGKGTKRYVS